MVGCVVGLFVRSVVRLLVRVINEISVWFFLRVGARAVFSPAFASALNYVFCTLTRLNN